MHLYIFFVAYFSIRTSFLLILKQLLHTEAYDKFYIFDLSFKWFRIVFIQ